MKKEVIVKLESKTYKIQKMPLGKWAELLSALKEIPQKIGQWENLSNDEILSKIPELIGTSLPELTKIVSIATDVSEAEITSMDELLELVAAALEVNNFESIIASIKKIAARRDSQPKQTLSTGSTEPSIS